MICCLAQFGVNRNDPSTCVYFFTISSTAVIVNCFPAPPIQRFNPNILKKAEKSVQYCCVAIGSRDRSVSIWFTSLKRPLVVVHDIFDDSVGDPGFGASNSVLLFTDEV